MALVDGVVLKCQSASRSCTDAGHRKPARLPSTTAPPGGRSSRAPVTRNWNWEVAQASSNCPRPEAPVGRVRIPGQEGGRVRHRQRSSRRGAPSPGRPGARKRVPRSGRQTDNSGARAATTCPWVLRPRKLPPLGGINSRHAAKRSRWAAGNSWCVPAIPGLRSDADTRYGHQHRQRDCEGPPVRGLR